MIAENLPIDTRQEFRDSLVNEAILGFEKFRQKHWRCEWLIFKDMSPLRCMNNWDSHGKSHQFGSQDDSAIIEVRDGKYHHEKGFDSGPLRTRLWNEIAKFSELSQALRTLEERAASLGIRRIGSQRTCFACLSNCPTNMLPCKGPKDSVSTPEQHAICEGCIRRFAKLSRNEGTIFTLDRCPLGCPLERGKWEIRVKPQTAQPRILALDGFVSRHLRRVL